MPEIHHQLQIDSPANAVFEAFTSPSGLNAWWTLEAGGEPKPGAVYRMYFGPGYDWLAKVVHVNADLELTWAIVRAMDDWMPTSFGFKLSETESGTRVRFFHSGWQDLSEHFAITNYCWGQLLKGLKDYVENGVVVPFDQRS